MLHHWSERAKHVLYSDKPSNRTQWNSNL